MLNEILPVLSNEITSNPPMAINHNYNTLIELCCYSNKSNELFCLSRNKQREYFLLTFSLMDQSLKSKRKIEIENESKNVTIDKIMLHSDDQDQLALIANNHIVIIKSIAQFTNNQIDHLYIKAFGGEKHIVHFSFSNFNDHYGILLSDGHFYFNSINHLPCYNLSAYLFNQSDIVSFAFFPLDENAIIENFMVIFMGKNGRLYLGGSIFPKEFTIENNLIKSFFNKENEENDNKGLFMSMIKDINESLIESNANTQSVVNGLVKKPVSYFKSSSNLLKYNSQMILQEIITNDIQMIDKQSKNKKHINEYKQLITLQGNPLTVIRVTTSNIIEVIILIGDLKPSSTSSIQISYHNSYVVEKIDLCESLFPLSLIKCIAISPSKYIIQLMSNIYSITIPYREHIREKMESESNIHAINLNQFKSYARKLIKRDPDNTSIPFGYYFIDVIYDELNLITLLNNSLSYKSINIASINDDNKYYNESNCILNQFSITQTHNSIIKGNQCNQRLLSRQFSFGGNEHEYNQDSDNENERSNGDSNHNNYYKQYIDMANEVNELFCKKSEEYQKQKGTINSLFIKRTNAYNVLLPKMHRYNSTTESIKELALDVKNKKEQITIQLKRIASQVDTIAQQKLQVYNNILRKEINTIKINTQQLEALASSCLPICKLKIKKNKKKLNVPFILGIDYITQSNFDYANKLMSDIKALFLEIKKRNSPIETIVHNTFSFNYK